MPELPSTMPKMAPALNPQRRIITLALKSHIDDEMSIQRASSDTWTVTRSSTPAR